jgi:hypothetical protein
VFYRPGTDALYQQVQVHDLVFNPMPEMDLLAIAYDGVGVVTCNPWSREQHDLLEMEPRILVSSRDGRTLFAGDHNGLIHILAFEQTLKVLYRISALRTMLLGLTVSPNALRVYDIRDKHCNVWEPPALVRRDSFDDASSEAPSSEAATVPIPEMVARPVSHEEYITCMTSPEISKMNVIFCGRRNGSVSVYDGAKGTRLLDFCLDSKHQYAIKHLEWHEKASVLVVVNVITQCTAVRVSITRSPRASCQVMLPPIFDGYAKHTVLNVLINQGADLFLFETLGGGELWNSTGTLIKCYNDEDGSEIWGKDKQWLQHPTDPTLFLLLRPTRVHIFRWETFQELTPKQGVPFMISSPTCGAEIVTSPASAWVAQNGCNQLVRLRRFDKERRTCFEFLNLDKLSYSQTGSQGFNEGNDSIGSDVQEVAVKCVHKTLLAPFKTVIGMYRSVLYFVDIKGWVSSVSLKDLQKAGDYTRHFFVPRSWMVGEALLLGLIPRSNSIAMAYQDDLLVFHGFLDLEEKFPFVSDGGLVRRWTDLGA